MSDHRDDEERAAGVLYVTPSGDWVTPSDVPPPGRQRQPLAEVANRHGQRIVVCAPAGYEYGMYALGEPVLGGDLEPPAGPLKGKEAAQAFIAVVGPDVYRRWWFAGREIEPGEARWFPLYACWLDPWPTHPA